MSHKLLKIGKPTHFAAGHKGWTACGLNGADVTDDAARVNCIRCLNTKAYKMRPGRSGKVAG